MASLGNNHGTVSHLNDLMTLYKMASMVNDSVKMDKFLNAIINSNYADSTKHNALRKLNRWELERNADAILNQN